MMATFASRARSRTARCICSVERTGTQSTPSGILQIRGAADENYARAATMRGFGERVAHFAGGAIGEEADRVEVFAGGTGGDENRLSGEIVTQAEDFANFFYDGFGGGQAAGAGHAAGQVAFVGIDDVNAAGAQGCEILLRRGMLPHVYVHRGGDDDRSFRGEIESGEKIFGDAVREFSEDVGGGRSDQQQVNALGYGDVFDGAFDVGGA